jgi:putative oxidoreductase
MNVFVRVHHRWRDVVSRAGWLAPLPIRLALGVTFVLSGWGKLHNLANVERYFASLGIPAASLQAPFVSSVELIGGVLVIAGLATRIASLLLAAVMSVALYTAIWPQADGVTGLLGSLEAAYLGAFVHLAIAGPGPVSIDHLVERAVPAFRQPSTGATS